LSSHPDFNAAEQASALPDLERFELRRFAAALGEAEFERHAGPVELADVARLLEGNPKAVIFDRPSGAGDAAPVALCGNLAGSRSRLAAAFDTTSENLLQEVLKRLRQKASIHEVTREAAPVSTTC
jgi:2,5-furandicarboxylate decarboxylase 1